MKSRSWMSSPAMCLIAALAITVQISAEKNRFTTIDPPGSTLTSPSGINPAGLITGYYVDSRGQYHGFLRAADGTFTTIDPPGSVSWTVPDEHQPGGCDHRILRRRKF